MQNKHFYQNEIIVSFIIPAYNIPAVMIHECIDSILALSLRSYEREIIVIDDGSDVSLLDSLGAYKDDIIYVRQNNSGLSVARNMGLKMASGHYIQFVDSDDKLITHLYEHCLDIVRFHSPDVVLFEYTSTPTDSLTYQDFDIQNGTDYMRHNNLRAAACAYLFKRSILGSLQFTPGIYHEDEEFTPQLILRAETLFPTDAKAYFYRKRPNSITTDKNVRQQLKRLNDKKDIIVRLDKLSLQMPIRERFAMQRRVAQLTMDYIYNVIVTTQNRHYLKRKLDELSRKGLFPLPDQDYTRKYSWFRKMTNSDMGITLLMRTLPLLKKER